MKKIFKVENVDCANCARKMQDNILKIEGITSATLNFLTQRLTVEFEESKVSTIVEEMQTACRKIDKAVNVIRIC